MRVGQQVEMLQAVETRVPPGTRGEIVALELPTGRATIAWETGAESTLPGTHDRVMVREAPSPTANAPAVGKRRSRRRRRRALRSRHLASCADPTLGEEVDGEWVEDAEALSFCRAFATDAPELHARLTLAALAGREEDALSTTAAELTPSALSAARRRRLVTEDESMGSLAVWLTEAERHEPFTRAAPRALIRAFQSLPDVSLDDAAHSTLCGTGMFLSAQQHIARAKRFNRDLELRRPRCHPDRIGWQAIQLWFTERWGVLDNADAFELAALDRGFPSRADFERRIRALVPYAILCWVPPFTVCSPPDQTAGRGAGGGWLNSVHR